MARPRTGRGVSHSSGVSGLSDMINGRARRGSVALGSLGETAGGVSLAPASPRRAWALRVARHTV